MRRRNRGWGDFSFVGEFVERRRILVMNTGINI